MNLSWNLCYSHVLKMEDDLSADYDVVVLGTGLPESIVAAAAARSGKTVLHLDRNDYYGNEWASFNLDGIRKWINIHNQPKENQSSDFKNLLNEGEKFSPITDDFQVINNATEKILITECIPEEDENVEEATAAIRDANINEETSSIPNDIAQIKEEEIKCEAQASVEETSISENVENTDTESQTGIDAIPDKTKIPTKRRDKPEIKHWKDLESLSRKFNLDLAPKILLSQGSLVNLLISSNISRYAEFKCVTRVLTYLNGKLAQVPCSRADVFSTGDVTLVEKRMLMKLLTFCMDYEQHTEEYRDFETKTFSEFLKSRKLTPNVQHYVLHAIAMVEKDSPTIEGLQAVQRFLKSLGRYGNTPFLWTLYGSGEIPQCFCRLCAVFGGVYYLKRSIEGLITNSDGRVTGIISQSKRINCRWLLAESSYFSNQTNSSEQRKTSRAIFVTDKSILKLEKEQITLLRLPAGGALKSVINVLELCPSSMACPAGLHVVHMTCSQTLTAEEDFKFALEILFDTKHYGDCDTDAKKPKILWCTYFNRSEVIPQSIINTCPQGVLLTSGPGHDFDFDAAVSEARTLFEQMYPEEEFLPRAPDPEEIILDGGDENTAPNEPPIDSLSQKTENEEASTSGTEVENTEGGKCDTDNGKGKTDTPDV